MKIKYFGNLAEDECDLEQADNILKFDQCIVLVDGQRIKTYEELVDLAAQDRYKDKEFIEVTVLPALMGG